jgi:WD40 repeat protein
MKIGKLTILAIFFTCAVLSACGLPQANLLNTQTQHPANLAASETALVPPSTSTTTPSPTLTPSSTPTLTPEPTATPTITPTPAPVVINANNAAKVTLLDTLKGFDGVSGILFSPEGVAALWVSEDDAFQPKLVQTLVPISEPGQDTWTFAAPAFSPDGKMYAGESKDNNGYTLTVYEVRDDLSLHAIVRNITGQYTLGGFSFTFSNDGKTFISIDHVQQIWTWPRDVWKCAPRCNPTITYKTMHNGIYQLPDGNLVTQLNITTNDISYHTNKFSPDNAYLANITSRIDENRNGWFNVQVWELDDGKLFRILDAMPFKMGEKLILDYSPSGAQIGILGGGKLQIWQWEPYTLLWTIDGIFSTLDYSPDGTLLAAGAPDGTIQLIRASDGMPLTRLIGHDHAITYVAFSLDGTLLASLDESGTLMLWNVPQ